MSNETEFLIFTAMDSYSSVLFTPVKGESIYKVNLKGFYLLGGCIHPLTMLTGGTPLKSVERIIINASLELRDMSSKLVPPIHINEKVIKRLDLMLERVLNYYQQDNSYVISDSAAQEIKQRAREFEHVLGVALDQLETYYVSQKAIYDTTALLERPEDIIADETIRGKLSAETLFDIKQAGKCIAFNIPTAAGIHIIRAVETVIRLYYEKVVGTLPKQKDRNWGAYIKTLEKAGGDKRIIGIIDHIREHYRNPLIHPDAKLELNDALSLFTVGMNAITMMILAI